MKRKQFLALILISFVSFVVLPDTFAQDYTWLNLPQEAKHRLGKGRITDMAYAPDGHQLAVSTNIGIWIYDARTGNALNTLLGQTNVNGIAYSPDGRTLVSGSSNSKDTIRLWDTTTGDHKATFREQAFGAYSIAFSPDGKTIAIGSYEQVQLWDAVTGARKTSFMTISNSVVSIIAFSPDGKTIATESDGNTIRLWDVATATHKATLQGHTNSVNSLTFSPDGRTLASSSWDYTIRLWDTTAVAHKATLSAPHIRYAPDSMAFSPDGRTLAHVGNENVVLWDVPSRQVRSTLTGHTTHVYNLAFSPDGRTIATGNGEIRLWDVVSSTHKTTFVGHMERVTSVAFSPDGQILASSESNMIHLWDGASGAPKTTLIGHTDDITSVAFSPDGQTLASSSSDKTVRLWNATTGTPKTTLTGHTWIVTSVAFSPDGRTLASSSWDKTIRFYDASSGHHKATITGHTDIINSVAFSPDGRTLASGSRDKTIRFWDARSGQHQRTLVGHTKGIYRIAFSPDGKTLASGTEYSSQVGVLWLWNTTTGKYKAGKSGFQGSVNFAFSPDGQTLATQTKMGQQVMLWDAATGVVKTTFPWHSGSFSNFAFSPDGQTLATGTGDGFIFLWKLTPDILQPPRDTSVLLPPLPAYPPQIRLIYFAPNDHTHQPNMGTELQTLAKQTQDFYAQQMENHGFGRKTFQLETDSNGKAVVHHLQGSRPAKDYISQNISIVRDLENLLDLIDHIYLVVLDPSLQGALGGRCGLALSYGRGVPGGAIQMSNNGRLAVVYASGDCAGIGTTAHEIGHTFGLSHDYRDKNYVMNHGPETPRFSYAAAEWLNVHPFFNPGQPNSENHTTIEILSPRASQLRFQIADTDGLHQAQLILTENVKNNVCGSTESLYHFQTLNGTSSMTLEFASTEVSTEARLRVIDRHGNISSKSLWIEPDSSVQSQQDTAIQPYEREMVRLIYFRPSDQPSRQGIDTDLDTLIRWSQYFFAEQMQDYGRKTFAFETDATGAAKVHHLTGKFTDTYYQSDTYNKVVKEVAEQFDTSRDVHLIAVDVSTEFINNEGTCGIGGGEWKSHDSELWRRDFGGTAVIPASGVCINPSVTAHELGHVFGLEHDFRDDAYLMAYGTQERLSHCAAEWLHAHRFFNNDPTTSDEAATINMLSSVASRPGTRHFRFQLTDADNLHQAQLIIPAANTDPAPGTKLHRCISLNGENQTVAFTVTGLKAAPEVEVTLQVIDRRGNITKQAFPIFVDDQGVNGAPTVIASDSNLRVAQHLSVMETPRETTLLPNYPNPFNPETWIPYQLASAGDVTLRIHALDGTLVRTLSLGYKAVGVYQSRSRAAYWDGRNEFGESITSGVYFYTLTTSDFNATRKMLIQK